MEPAPANGSYVVPPVLAPVDALDDDALALLRSKLQMLIAKRIDGIDYAERRRQQAVAQMAAVVALGLAFLPLVASAPLPLRAAYSAASVVLVIGGLMTWILYARQVNPRYAFLGPAQSRTWFYRQALPDHEALMEAAAHTREDFKLAHDKQLEDFATVQTAIMSDLKLDTSDDLRQLFLLHQNEMTKNQQLSLLSKALGRTIMAALFAALLVGALALVITSVGGAEEVGGSSSTSVASLGDVDASWYGTGSRRTTNGFMESELIVDITVTNTSGSDVTVTAVTATDGDGRGVPIDTAFEPIEVVAGGSNTVGPVVAWVPTSVADEIASVFLG